MRFDGWEQWDKPSSGQMIGGEWSVVLHTTEGSTIEGAISALDRQNSWPQFMACPRTGRRIQAIDSSLAGKALSNKSGGVETNRENTIQIEIVGFAHQSQDWSDEWYDWLAEILEPIMDHHGIGKYGPTFYGQGAGFVLATANARQRMSFDQWNEFGGVCGHQHVPENDHWDPGAFRLDKFFDAMGGGIVPKPRIVVPMKKRSNRMVSIFAADGMHFYSVPQEGEFAGALIEEYGMPNRLSRAVLMPAGSCKTGPETALDLLDVVDGSGAFGFVISVLDADGRRVHKHWWKGDAQGNFTGWEHDPGYPN
jgi:hypothetical protein